MVHSHESLFFREGSSDKQYDLTIEKRGETYVAFGRWGRRGNLGKPQTWYEGPDLAEAEKIVAKNRAKKTAKGYTRGDAGVPYSEAIASGEHSGILPMLLAPIDAASAERYLSDPDYWMQEKYDGVRLLIERGENGVRGINRKGEYVGLPANVSEQIGKLPGFEYLLDGELVSGRYIAFDLLRDSGKSLASTPYRDRHALLCDLVDRNGDGISVFAAQTWDTEGAKRRAFNDLLAGAEGVVFKSAGAGHAPGTRSERYVKCKFWESATCMVDGINEQRSIRLAMICNGERIGVGNCTVPSNYEIPAIDAFVEIKYLYAYRGGSLYQPQYHGQRADVSIGDCYAAQLKYKGEGREVAA
jgi:bifunctional non-homologous end joining protein LigD